MGQKRDMTGIETRIGRKGHEKFRAYTGDPARPGRKLTAPWGTYEEALEWRRRFLAVKAEAKRQARNERMDEMLDSLESSLRDRRPGR
jgi:hypothetical protein